MNEECFQELIKRWSCLKKKNTNLCWVICFLRFTFSNGYFQHPLIVVFFHYWDEFYCKFSNFHVQKQQLAHLNSQKNVMFVRFFNQRIVLQYESQPFNYLYYIALNLSDWFQNKTSKCCFFFIGRFWTIKNWHANKQTGFSNFIQTIAHAAADWRPCCYVILTEFNFRFERFLDAEIWSKKSFYQTK